MRPRFRPSQVIWALLLMGIACAVALFWPLAEGAPVLPKIPTLRPVVPNEELVREAAVSHGLRQAWVLGVAWRDSRYRQEPISKRGAVGVMQLRPKFFPGVRVWDAGENIEAGTVYLATLLARWGSERQAERVYRYGNAGRAMTDKLQD